MLKRTKWITILSLAIVTMLIFVGCSSKKDDTNVTARSSNANQTQNTAKSNENTEKEKPKSDSQEQVNADVIELRTAAQESEPKFFISDEGGSSKMIGICADALRAIEEIDGKIKFVGLEEFVPMPRIEEMLEANQLDVFAGFVKNDARAEKYIFVDIPLYYERNVLLVRADDSIEINNLEEIKELGEIVLVSSGIAQAKQLKEMGIDVDDNAQTPEQNIQKLIDGRGRFMFQTETTISTAVRNLGVLDKVKILPVGFNESGRYLALSKETPQDVVDRIIDALDKLTANGELAKIYNKYTSQ